MDTMRVQCPSCGLALRVPSDSLGKKGRCKACGGVFRLRFTPAVAVSPPLAPVPADRKIGPGEGDILNWINEDPASSYPSGVEQADTAPPDHGQYVADRPGPRRPDEPAHAHRYFPVHLGHVDEMGAFFLFDPALLSESDFRLTLPRRCLTCGGHERLQVHRVVWAAMLPVREQFGVRMSIHPVVYDLATLAIQDGQKFLHALQVVENMPEPYCLPFPYFVCSACSPVGTLVTDVRKDEVGQSQCELGLYNLDRAVEFAASVCGQGSEVVRAIRKANMERGMDPWRALPLPVQSRIRKWFKPDKDEHFYNFIPDSEFAKSESGAAGVLVTDHRIICHRFLNTIDLPLAQPVTVAPHRSGGNVEVRIISGAGRTATALLSPPNSERFRRTLAEHGVKAKWIAE